MLTAIPLRPLAAAVLALSVSTLAHAAEDWFLKSPDFRGDALVKGREGQVALNSFQWSVTADTSWVKGSGAAVGKATPGAVSWNQGWDSSISTIYTDMFGGKSVSTATIEMVPNSGASKPVAGFSTKMDNVLVTEVSKNLSSGYTVSSVAKTMQFTYNPAAWGDKGSEIKLNWDIATHSSNTVGPIEAKAVPGTHGAATGDGVTAYLRLGSSAGSSTAIGYENWTEVSALNWDVTALSSWIKGGGASVGMPDPGVLSWSQSLDAGLLYNLSNIFRGTSVPTMVIEYVSNSSSGPVTFMQDVFTNVYFREVSIDGLNVTNEVVFDTAAETIWGVDKDGKRGNVLSSIKWDIRGGKVDTKGSPVTTDITNFGAGQLTGELVALPSTGAPPVGAPPPLPVPEPQSWLLMLCGGLLLALRRRAA